MLAADAHPKAGIVFGWYHTLPSRCIDLFSDYAGNDLFLIEFDSLLLHCFSDSNIDFSQGFQLLHAVYVVENLLIRRNAWFQIICFQQSGLLCTPAPAGNDEVPNILEHADLKKLPETTLQPPEFANLQPAPFAHFRVVGMLDNFSTADLATTLALQCSLAAKEISESLPCLVFNYDRIMCEMIAHSVIDELQLEIARSRAAKAPRKEPKKKNKRSEDDDDEKVSRAERARKKAEADISVWAGFNPNAPIDGFHFADITKLAMSELAEIQYELRDCRVPEWLVLGLERGVATGTLALGINMPCKTVVFADDSTSPTVLNFRQAAGRAGRRGFDVLGNVVFVGISKGNVFRLLSSRLPDLTMQYPINVSFVLRLVALLHGPNSSPFALHRIHFIFSRLHLFLGPPESEVKARHYLRFSIEYLRRQLLLDTGGAPINFARCISPLYYTGNSVWAFHALLRKGYFHELCKDIEINLEPVHVTLMLVLSSIFERQSCKRSDLKFVDNAIKHSSSVVFLPPLPDAAKEVLSSHDADFVCL
ncbi:hypothetical protein E0Z10_g3894 [Xylaria hypoxylon]|uniref:Helicase C-terminal domain-containing protein n=1 Tax=Xylaria hypoxylon TaxID=37992 RepID=A0A4Z0Z635_9PEZI|nr:hypothetical protein E0Z10_g3894 [Xylaria hypoxylon]